MKTTTGLTLQQAVELLWANNGPGGAYTQRARSMSNGPRWRYTAEGLRLWLDSSPDSGPLPLRKLYSDEPLRSNDWVVFMHR